MGYTPQIDKGSQKSARSLQDSFSSESQGKVLGYGIDASPFMVAQRRKLNTIFGNVAQLSGMAEETLQDGSERTQGTNESLEKMPQSTFQMYSETKTRSDTDIRELAAARRHNYPQLGTAAHNFAVEKGNPITWAASDVGGHSESRASANALGSAIGGDFTLTLLSERQPCNECEATLRDVEASTADAVKVKARYLADFGDDDAPGTLRELYRGL